MSTRSRRSGRSALDRIRAELSIGADREQLEAEIAGLLVRDEHAELLYAAAVEAYRVLSDPTLRERYDERLRRQEGTPEQVVVRSATAEPLTREPIPLFGRTDEIRPSFDAMFDRLVRNFTRVGFPKSEHLEPLNCDVVLSPEEASRGGVLPIAVPVFEACPECGGSGHTWLFPCTHCGQSGTVGNAVTVRLEIPPMVRAGTIIDLPLEGLGVSNLRLRIVIHIDRESRGPGSGILAGAPDLNPPSLRCCAVDAAPPSASGGRGRHLSSMP